MKEPSMPPLKIKSKPSSFSFRTGQPISIFPIRICNMYIFGADSTGLQHKVVEKKTPRLVKKDHWDTFILNVTASSVPQCTKKYVDFFFFLRVTLSCAQGSYVPADSEICWAMNLAWSYLQCSWYTLDRAKWHPEV